MRLDWLRGLALGVLAVALPFMLSACGGDGESHEKQVPGAAEPGVLSVRTAEVREEAAPSTTAATGVVEPIRRAMPAGRLMGTVTAAPFQEGDRVREGQVLVRIDVQDLAARRAQVLAQVREAQAVLRDAETHLARMRVLSAEGAIARVQLEQAETGVARARAAVQTANAGLRELEANAAYGTIEAPFSGVIVRKMVEVGNLAAPGQPLFVLEDLSRVRVVAGVGEEAAIRLRKGQRMSVEIAGGRLQATGVVEAVLPSGDPSARGFRVNILLDNAGLALQSGMTATVRMPTESVGEASPALVVPAQAVVRRGQMTGVFVVDRGIARLRWIRMAEAEGDRVRVLSGLHAGERVVVGPERERLQDRQRVRLGAEGVG